jgi:putative membrane protein
MQLRAHDRVRELTALLSVVSLALVFSAVGGVVPAGVLPRVAPLVAAVPHVNAAVSLAAIGTITYGVVSIRRGRIASHRRAMLASLVLFVTFLVLYLYRVSLEGPTPFPGPDPVYRFVYLPTLAIHILLAIACIPLLYYVVLLALTHDVADLPETPHPRVGRVAATLWLISFTLGLVVYVMLYVVY